MVIGEAATVVLAELFFKDVDIDASLFPGALNLLDYLFASLLCVLRTRIVLRARRNVFASGCTFRCSSSLTPREHQASYPASGFFMVACPQSDSQVQG